MINPINGHLIIEPLKHESFISTEKGTFEEIGIVVNDGRTDGLGLEKGTKVYFDSWLAAKFPGKKDGEYLWLVKYDDIRAIETNDEIPK